MEFNSPFIHSTAASVTAVFASHFDVSPPLRSPLVFPIPLPLTAPLDLQVAFQHCPG